MTVDALFVGIDTSKDLIEAFVRPTGEVWTPQAGEEGVAELSEKLMRVHPKLVLMQATGGFELTFAGVLAILGLPFALVQPRNIPVALASLFNLSGM